MQVESKVVKPYVQSKAEAARTASWRRHPVHQWRGRSLSTAALMPLLVPIAAARRRDAICRLMEENGIANTERGHRHAYATIWTDRVRRRLGDPPRPATLVRWRRKRIAVATASRTVNLKAFVPSTRGRQPAGAAR